MEQIKLTDYKLPYGYIDESGQIITTQQGAKIIGCPDCGAVFVNTCFCGFSTKENNKLEWCEEHNCALNECLHY